MKDKEVRYFENPVEYREENEGEIVGVAAVVSKRTNLVWYDEIIEPGAFDDVLGDDVRALMNHDPNLVLARTKAGTLTIELDGTGNLTYRYKTPERSYAKDLEDAIKSGDITQSSFAFRVKEDAWEFSKDRKANDLRKIIKLERLYDVAPVTYPAYQDTTVAKRSFDENKPEPEENQPNKKLLRDLYIKLKKLT